MRIVTIARKPFKGATTANVVEHEAGAFDIDGVRVGEKKRWPSNMLLMHKANCEIVGERKVPTGTAHREKSGGKTIFSETEKKTMPNMTYADEDGMETIPAWECEDGCPVAYMDTGGASRFFKQFGGKSSSK